MIPSPTVEAQFLPMSSYSFLEHFSRSGRRITPRPLPTTIRSLAVPPCGTGRKAKAPEADSVTAASTLKVYGGLVGKVNSPTLQIGFGVPPCSLELSVIVLDGLKRTTKLGVAHKVRGGPLGTCEILSTVVIPRHGFGPPFATSCLA